MEGSLDDSISKPNLENNETKVVDTNQRSETQSKFENDDGEPTKMKRQKLKRDVASDHRPACLPLVPRP